MTETVPESWKADSWEAPMRAAVADGVNLYPYAIGVIEAILADLHSSDSKKIAQIREVLIARGRVDAGPSPIAAHYDASATLGEFTCACASPFDDLAALRWHIETGNADPTGLAYSRADDEPDDPTPVSGARVASHVGAVTDEGLVDETGWRDEATGLTSGGLVTNCAGCGSPNPGEDCC